ncbi:MAG: hypothetical protein WC551_02700 [Patescibacteria group bacterium]
MEQEIKRRGRPKKVDEVVEIINEQSEEIKCGHNSLIEDKGETLCALCGKRVV